MIESLFICYTPLHALIARAIIKKEHIDNYALLFFCGVNNEKHKYYYNNLAKKSLYSAYGVISKNIVVDANFLYGFTNELKKKGISKNFTVYTGNIKILYSRLVILLMNTERYVTFDDGSGNISRAGYFYNNDERSFKEWFFRLLKPSLQYSTIKKGDHLHYTIFKHDNIFSNTKYIQLASPKNCNNVKGKLNILMTNAFSEDGELDKDLEYQLYMYLIDRYEIDEVLRHPREVRNKITNRNVDIVDTIMVAEDYVRSKMEYYDVTVYGVYSTALLTMASFDCVKLVNIDVQLKKETTHLRKLFDEIGIETIDDRYI